MANGFKVKVSDKGAQRALVRLRGVFEDMRPALSNAAAELTRRMKYRFSFKRDPDGQRWAPWSARTAAAAKSNPKRGLMLNTRRTRDTSKFIAGRKDIRAVIGTPYGARHEQPNPGGRIPRRAFMLSYRNGRRGLAKNDEAYLRNALLYQIRKAADK